MRKEPYFADTAKRALLWDIAISWRGTPFRKEGAKKGRTGGVSCTNLVQAICSEVGISEADTIQLPKASMKHHEHNSGSVIQDYLASPECRKRLKRLDVEDNPRIHVGDVLGVMVKKTEHHLGLYIGRGQVIHCDRKKGVLFVSLDLVKPHLRSIYRIH